MGSDINHDANCPEYARDSRGNICPVTIILPTIAMMADRDPAKFKQLLAEQINNARTILKERYQYIVTRDVHSCPFITENNLFEGFDGKSLESMFKHGTLAIGQLGLAEAEQLLFGKDHTDPEVWKFALEIELMFENMCKQFTATDKLNYSVYDSPAENLCYTALLKFRKKYGVIKNVSDRDFFTNSVHIPVFDKVDIFTKIDLEAPLAAIGGGGNIVYTELASSGMHNIDALETIINYAAERGVPYFALNLPNDTCLDCGAVGEFATTCPKCGGDNIERIRRVTGYLSKVPRMNDGKQAEVAARVKHIGGERHEDC